MTLVRVNCLVEITDILKANAGRQAKSEETVQYSLFLRLVGRFLEVDVK